MVRSILAFVLAGFLFGCGSKSAPAPVPPPAPPSVASAEPTPVFESDKYCPILEAHMLDVATASWCDENEIPDNPVARGMAREMLEHELRSRGVLNRFEKWCSQTMTTDTFMCGIAAKTMDSVNRCYDKGSKPARKSSLTAL